MSTIAKQVTNGAQPLAAVVASHAIYEAFMAASSPQFAIEFPHGYTYSAHPVACAAGVATLDVIVKEDMVTRVAALAPHFITEKEEIDRLVNALHDALAETH